MDDANHGADADANNGNDNSKGNDNAQLQPQAQAQPPDAHPAGPGQPVSRFVLGYYTEPEPPVPLSSASLARNHEWISAAALFWYQFSPAADGSWQPFGGFDPQTAPARVQEVHQLGVGALALFHQMLYGDMELNHKVAHAILVDRQVQQRALREMVRVVQENGFDGVNIDFEYMPPLDRYPFTNFLRSLRQTLPADKMLVVSVHGKTADEPDHPWSGAFDYAAIAPHVDFLQVMSYQEHGPGTPPGTTASLTWWDRLAAYTRSQVPPEKVLWGLGTYGFDWVISAERAAERQRWLQAAAEEKAAAAPMPAPGAPAGDQPQPLGAAAELPAPAPASHKAEYMDYTRLAQRAAAGGAGVQISPDGDGAVAIYQDEAGRWHEGWVENADSTERKLQAVDRYGFAGIGIWRLGMEDPAMWPRLAQRWRALKP